LSEISQNEKSLFSEGNKVSFFFISIYKQVNEIKAEVPSGARVEEGIRAKRRALISEGCKPCFLFSLSCGADKLEVYSRFHFSSADEKPSPFSLARCWPVADIRKIENVLE
jgi:hypothetical protein